MWGGGKGFIRVFFTFRKRHVIAEKLLICLSNHPHPHCLVFPWQFCPNTSHPYWRALNTLGSSSFPLPSQKPPGLLSPSESELKGKKLSYRYRSFSFMLLFLLNTNITEGTPEPVGFRWGVFEMYRTVARALQAVKGSSAMLSWCLQTDP